MLKVNISAINVRNTSRTYFTTVRLDVKTRDAQMALDSAVLSVIQSSSNPLLVQVNATVTGGHPYSCELTFGDQAGGDLIIDSVENLNVFEMEHTYDRSGVYNITLLCSQEANAGLVSLATQSTQ